MPATFIKGDLLHEAAEVSSAPLALAFPADCGGTMAAGIAVAIRDRWPAFAEAFRARSADGKMQLGEVFAWNDGPLFIYALGVQKGSGKPRVSTIERALTAMVERATADGVTRILLPRIGGGKSGVDPARVKRVLIDVASKTPIDVVTFEQFIRVRTPLE